MLEIGLSSDTEESLTVYAIVLSFNRGGDRRYRSSFSRGQI